MALSVDDILKLSAAGISQEDIERISAQTDQPAPPPPADPKPLETEVPPEEPETPQTILSGLLK